MKVSAMQYKQGVTNIIVHVRLRTRLLYKWIIYDLPLEISFNALMLVNSDVEC